MKHLTFSHCDGDKTVPVDFRKSIADAITAVKTIPGESTSAKIRDEILAKLKVDGWPGEVRLSTDSEMTITSVRDKIGLCLQTGNVARAAYDLMKLQTLYYEGHIRGAMIIVPSKAVAKKLNKGLVDSTRFARELAIFKKAYNVPTVVFSLEA